MTDGIRDPDSHMVTADLITIRQQTFEQAKAALKDVEKYLVERGIEQRGTVGRTVILPQIRKALAAMEAL